MRKQENPGGAMQLSSFIHQSAIDTFGKERRNTDWYDVNLRVIQPVATAKMKDIMRWKQDMAQVPRI